MGLVIFERRRSTKGALFRILMSFVFAEGESGDANGKKEKVEDVEAPAAAATGGEEAS